MATEMLLNALSKKDAGLGTTMIKTAMTKLELGS